MVGDCRITSDPAHRKSATSREVSKKVASKLFILQRTVPATFFRPRLAPHQSIASRNVALCMLKESVIYRLTSLWGETAPPRRTFEMRGWAEWGVSSGPGWYVDCPVSSLDSLYPPAIALSVRFGTGIRGLTVGTQGSCARPGAVIAAGQDCA